MHLAKGREAMRRYIERNRELLLERKRVAHAAKPVSEKMHAHLLRHYGITYEEYLEIHASQAGRCAICGQPETVLGNHGKVKNLSVDHDHETGKVRGLLCNNCNRAVGLFGDDLLTLASAFAYLEAHSEAIS